MAMMVGLLMPMATHDIGSRIMENGTFCLKANQLKMNRVFIINKV